MEFSPLQVWQQELPAHKRHAYHTSHYQCIKAVLTVWSSTSLQVWQQEFAWTEEDKPIKLAARALAVPDNQALLKRPMFCFETMMHLVYWSCLVYDYRRVGLRGCDAISLLQVMVCMIAKQQYPSGDERKCVCGT